MSPASTWQILGRVALAAATATISRPVAFQYQPRSIISGEHATSATPAAAPAAGSVASLVRVPARATVITAPTPAYSQPAPWMTAYIDTEARMTATAAVAVSL